MLTKIQLKRSTFYVLLICIIDGKLSQGQIPILVFLCRADIMPQHIFHYAICSLRLAIGLRMESRGHMLTCTEQSHKLSSE
jgi:hypothetical protein